MKVSEIFTSFQGEGVYAGIPATFLRLFGCNLNCEWCDTDITTFEILSVDEVSEIIKTQMEFNNIETLVITGGEPTLQMEEINRLVKKLPNDIKIQMETNGSLFSYVNGIDYVVSPKKDKEEVFKNYYAKDNVYFKFVISSQEDIDEVIYLKNKYNYNETIWLQPEFSRDVEITNLIRDNFPYLNNIKLSVQTHKYLNQR